jgi:LuxR family maltose regulon positive regulatory protein
MPIALLATKLYIPPARADIVSRPRLTEKLRIGLERPGSLTLLSGPAGAGKTTLLSEFIAQSPRPVAWLSLDERDNEPVRFWTYLVAACQSVVDGVGESALALLEEAQALPDESIPTLLINDLAQQDGALALVLDDYHAIRNQSIHAGLSFLVDYLPDNLHLIVSTRADPPWPLARYRARNRLVEIRARDLRFSREEAAEFLNRTMGLNLPAEDVAALEDRTEGWAAGLQLAALSMQGRDDTAAFVQAFAGSHAYVADYLVTEILRRQPEDVQAFLLETSILERMNAGLCEAVTGRGDAQSVLTALHRANILIVPLDDRGEWYRYHHLFADLLQARLPQARPAGAIAGLHTAAADWYQQHGFTAEAIDHGLAAGDFERVASLVEGAARAMIFAGRMGALAEWLEALPEETLEAHPRLAFYLLWVNILRSRADLSEQAFQDTIERLKALPPSAENDRLRGELMAVMCRATVMTGDVAGGIRLAHEALGALSESDLASRARVNSALAAAYGLAGRIEDAELAYRECVPQAVAAGDYRLAAHTMMIMGLTLGHYGRLHDAARAFESIVRLQEQSAAARPPSGRKRTGRIFFPAGQGYIGLAGIHLEWNDLETAERYLEQGMELCRQGGLDGLFAGRMLRSRLRQARGDLEGALEAIEFAREAFQRADDFQMAVRQVQIALAQGDVGGAYRKAAPLETLAGADPARLPPIFMEVIEAVLARVYLAQDETGKAFQMLDRLEATARPGGRAARLIEGNLLRALALQRQDGGNVTPEAVGWMERSLELAEPEGYILLFLEEGPAVIPLLEAVAGHRGATDPIQAYARRLLEAHGADGELARRALSGEAAGLVEALTPREMEVLALIAAGHSNRAIADRLVVTVRTVKKHASNIYGKLNVSSRTQAVARARELGLLPIDP